MLIKIFVLDCDRVINGVLRDVRVLYQCAALGAVYLIEEFFAGAVV